MTETSPSKAFDLQTVLSLNNGEINTLFNLIGNPNPLNKIFSDPVGFFTTNEYDYPNSLDQIKVSGGIHIGIMGGLDPVFGQISVAKPDLSLIFDINEPAMQTALEGRIETLLQSENGIEYWKKVEHYFVSKIKELNPKRYDYPNNQDISLGGCGQYRIDLMMLN